MIFRRWKMFPRPHRHDQIECWCELTPEDAPGHPARRLDFAAMVWTCMVCGDERPDAFISVVYRPVVGMEDYFPDSRVNVRYCNDRSDCVAAARGQGPWMTSRSRHSPGRRDVEPKHDREVAGE